MDVRWILLIFLTTNAGLSTADLALQPEGSVHAYFSSDNFIITCSARDADTTELRWYDPSGEEITQSAGRIHIESSSGNVELRLVWEKAEHEDAGKYRCTGNADDDEIIFELIVYGSINFSKVEHVQRGKESDNLTVICDPDGTPTPSISWKFKGVSLINNSANNKYEVGGNRLKIYNLNREDAGDYTCIAMIVTEHASQIKNTVIKVQVEYAPEWKNEKYENLFSRVGHSVNLTCEADAEPFPVFMWKRNEETIHPSDSYSIYNEPDMTVLQVTVHNDSLFGDYECIAKNPLGIIKRSVILEQGDAPGPPTLDIVSNESGTLTLDISPSTETMLEVTGYKVEYKLTSENWNNVNVIQFDRGSQYILKNLSYETEYVVRVAARNAVGYGEYSREITTRTKNFNSDSVKDSAFSSQSSTTIAALLSTSVSLWVLRL